MNKVIAIFGGSQESTFKQIGKKYGVDILFHDGKSKKGGSKAEIQNLVKKADICVMMVGALGHVKMDMVKDVCKKENKELLFHRGFGASGAVQLCLNQLNKAA